MKHIFKIGESKESDPDQLLVLDLGMNDCCWGIFNTGAQRFSEIGFEEFDQAEGINDLTSLLEQIRQKASKAFVAFNNPFSILFPDQLFKDDHSMIKSLFAIEPMEVSYDTIREWRIINQYAVPRRVYDLVGSSLSDARYLHGFTPALKQADAPQGDTQIQVHCYRKEFRVVLRSRGNLLLVQMYEYNTPLDVVYYLLKICLEFKLEQDQVRVLLSGLVDNNSSLYREIHSYFTHTGFVDIPEGILPDTEMPGHYFSGLIKLAQCAS